MQQTCIELHNISFSYPGHSQPVFENLHFRFQGGRIGLIGDNGSGKTTLFHIMVGLLKPEIGNVLLDGKILHGEKEFRVLRQKVGMLFQNADDQLFSPSVLEDVAFGPLNLGHTTDAAKEIAITTLGQVGLSGYENRITHHLSGGEKRLVALATILAMKPEILLLDEPTNDLDHDSRHRLLDILNDLEQSLILISHDWDFLTSLASKFYSLEHGALRRSERIKVHQHKHAHPLGDQQHLHHH